MARKRADGEGTIYEQKHRNRWVGEFSYFDNAAGKTKRKTFTGKTQKEVVHKGKEFLKSIESGLLPEADKLTVGEWVDRWLEDYARPNISIRTYEKYSSDLRGYVIPGLGQVKLNKLRSPEVQHFFNELLISGRKRPRKGETISGLSTSTVRSTRRYFTMAMDKALELGLIQKNIIKQTKPPKLIKKEIHPLNDEQARALLEIAKTGEYMPKEYYQYYQKHESDYIQESSYMIILLTLHTGMRRGEVLGLRWDDIDFEKKKINIKRSLVVSKIKGVIFQDTKTKGSRRSVSIPESVIKALIHYRKIQMWFINLIGNKYEDDSGVIFTTSFGKPVNGCSFVNRVFKKMLAKAHIDQTFTFHDLRHTHATLLLRQGVNIKVISERLGHSTIAMTLDTYSHLMPDMQETAVKAIDRMLG